MYIVLPDPNCYACLFMTGLYVCAHISGHFF